MLPQFSYTRPTSLDDALEQLSADGAVPHAGGLDLLGCLRDGVFQAQKVVSLSSLDELKGIRQGRGGGLRIGALTTVAEVARNPLIMERYAALAQAAAEVASPQLRNQGTLGGNLCQKPRCWYYRGDFHCLRKGGSTWRERTSTTAFWEAVAATASTSRTPLPRWWRWAHRCRSRVRKAPGPCPWRSSTSRPVQTSAGRRCSSRLRS